MGVWCRDLEESTGRPVERGFPIPGLEKWPGPELRGHGLRGFGSSEGGGGGRASDSSLETAWLTVSVRLWLQC